MIQGPVGPFSFPKSSRLLHRTDFNRVRKLGRRRRTEWVDVFGLSTGEPGRLGLAMSRKVGSSVQRNLLKRWVREWFRTARPSGFDLLVVGRPGVGARLPASSRELWDGLEACVRGLERGSGHPLPQPRRRSLP